MRVCEIEDCERTHYSRGWCAKHYWRWYHHGNPHTALRPYLVGRPDTLTKRVNGKSFRRYVLVAEEILGKRLPRGAVVHHVDGDRSNNAPNNLVICQSQGYHSYLHLRQRALRECGHATWRKCWICQEWDALENVKVDRESAAHYECLSFKRHERWVTKGT